MIFYIFKLIGVAGLILITFGILSKTKIGQNILFFIGGALLIIYSIYLKDLIFIILEIFFTIAAIYAYYKEKKNV